MPTKIQRARSRTATHIETRPATITIRFGDIDLGIPHPIWDAAVREYLTFLAETNLDALHSLSQHISDSIDTGVSA